MGTLVSEASLMGSRLLVIVSGLGAVARDVDLGGLGLLVAELVMLTSGNPSIPMNIMQYQCTIVIVYRLPSECSELDEHTLYMVGELPPLKNNIIIIIVALLYKINLF